MLTRCYCKRGIQSRRLRGQPVRCRRSGSTRTGRSWRSRVKAIGVWSATIPRASAVGVLAGGLLSQEAGWRWVFFVNLPVCADVITGAVKLLGSEGERQGHRRSER